MREVCTYQYVDERGQMLYYDYLDYPWERGAFRLAWDDASGRWQRTKICDGEGMTKDDHDNLSKFKQQHSSQRWAAIARATHQLQEYNALAQRHIDLQKELLRLMCEQRHAATGADNPNNHMWLGNRGSQALCLHVMEQTEKKMDSVGRSADYWAGIAMGKKPSEQVITDEMIENARAVPIRMVVEKYFSGIEIGPDNKALCPFHQEKTPSFHINERKNNCHCYGRCGETWNSIGVVMATGCTFPEAVRRLQ